MVFDFWSLTFQLQRTSTQRKYFPLPCFPALFLPHSFTLLFMLKLNISYGSSLNLSPEVRPTSTARGSPLSLQIRQVPGLRGKCEFSEISGLSGGPAISLFYGEWSGEMKMHCSQVNLGAFAATEAIFIRGGMNYKQEGAEISFDTSSAESKWWIDRPNHHLTSSEMNNRGTIHKLRKPPDASFLSEQFDWLASPPCLTYFRNFPWHILYFWGQSC